MLALLAASVPQSQQGVVHAGKAIALAAGIAWASERSSNQNGLVTKLLSVMMYGLAEQPS